MQWNGESKEVTLLLDGKEIKMTIGKTLENMALHLSSWIAVPMCLFALVADALGAQTSWK